MSDIAKKYAKALVNSVDNKTLETIFQKLQQLVPAFKDKKFISIVQSSEITKAQKTDFLLGMLDMKDEKLENFIKLLVEKKRIDLIPAIVTELNKALEEKTNTYHGNLISSEKVADKEIQEIEKVLSKKFDATIKLDNVVSDYSGMKVEIENLGVEIAISTDRIKQQIAQTILSAI